MDRRNRVKLVISNIYRISHLTPHPLASSRTVRFRETGAKVPVIQCLTSLLLLLPLLLHSFLIRLTSYFRTVPPSLETADYPAEGHPTWLNPRPAIPSPFVPLPNPRSSCTWHAAYPLGRRRAAAARRPLARSQHQRNRPRRSTRAPTATANAARPDPLILAPERSA